MKARVGKARMALLGTLLMLQMLPQASAATVTDVSDLRLEYFYPAIVAFAIAIPVWRWFIPNQLANLPNQLIHQAPSCKCLHAPSDLACLVGNRN